MYILVSFLTSQIVGPWLKVLAPPPDPRRDAAVQVRVPTTFFGSPWQVKMTLTKLIISNLLDVSNIYRVHRWIVCTAALGHCSKIQSLLTRLSRSLQNSSRWSSLSKSRWSQSSSSTDLCTVVEIFRTSVMFVQDLVMSTMLRCWQNTHTRFKHNVFC